MRLLRGGEDQCDGFGAECDYVTLLKTSEAAIILKVANKSSQTVTDKYITS